ncbi:MAG: mannose-6-phosphate isomerase, class I [Streptococcaceae bacterium]|jgi:mannose-6-phosphate isomerase|nr:mannose-6-phosphate isomerase, class I [Streptococcaceae bacterium]
MTKEPLFLNSVFHEKIWGGGHLKAFGYQLPNEKVGEYWAISGHPHGVSTVINGEYAGWKLDKLYTEHRELFANSESPVFPLLTKILDANDWLSVQVHPDDAYAAEHEGELGKTECWYVISAEPGAEIIYGHTAKTREELSQMIHHGEWDKLLTKVPVKTGDFFYVPSGTMHAIGAGCLILETQQSSDTTYRVYDFDRRDKDGNLRELHLEKSIDVLTIPGDHLPDNHTKTALLDNAEITTLVEGEFFDIYKWLVTGSSYFEKTDNYVLCSVLSGEGNLRVDGKNYALEKGNHFILPTPVNDFYITALDPLEMIVSNPAVAKGEIVH